MTKPVSANTLADILGGHMLLNRPYHRWCPLCLREWRATGQTVYEPLIWSLAVVAGCPRHHVPLSSQCPQCGTGMYPFTRVYLWTCPRCQCPLDEEVPTGTVTERQRLSAELVGELLAALPSFAGHSILVAENIRYALERWGATRLAQRVQDSHVVDYDWMQGRRTGLPAIKVRIYKWMRTGRMQLDSLVSLGIAMDVRLPALLFGHLTLPSIPPPQSDADVARSVGLQVESRSNDFEGAAVGVVQPKRQLPDLAAAQSIVYGILRVQNADKPPTLEQIAHQAGCSRIYIDRHFPGLVRQLRQIYWDALRRRLEELQRADPPQSVFAIAKAAGVNIGTVKLRFPELAASIRTRYQESGREQAEQRRREIEEALVSFLADSAQTPTSLREVAQRVNTAPYVLYEQAPDLSKVVVQQTTENRRHRHRLRVETILQSIHTAILALEQEGIPVTSCRVAQRAGIDPRRYVQEAVTEYHQRKDGG